VLTFTGYLDRKRFAIAAGIRIGLFVLSVVLFPLLLMGLANASGCRGVGGACGALGLVVAMAYKPLVAVAFVFSFVGISLRRARDAGAASWIGLFVPLLLAADYQLLTVVGAPWSLGFTLGILHVPLPRFAMMALWCILAMSLLPSRADDDEGFGPAGRVAAGLAAVIAVFAALQALSAAPALSALLLPLRLALSMLLRSGQAILPFAMLALSALLAWFVWRGRAVEAPVRVRADRQPGGSLARLDLPLVVVAAVVTLVAFSNAVGRDAGGVLVPIALLTGATSIVLPTFLIYLAPLWAAAWVARSRSLLASACLGATLLPYLHWGYAHLATAREQAREVAEIDAIPTVKASHVPPVLVFESSSSTGMGAAWTVPGVERVISKGAYSGRLMQFTRVDGSRRRQETTLTALPNEYLLLKVRRESTFAKKGQIYAALGGLYELRLVSGSRDDLIAVSYRAFKPRPSSLPVLTTSGWYRGSNSATTDEIAASIEAFLAKALGHSRSAAGLRPRLPG
jgi:uncharacterized membrane protein YhaH (DUF805 family)